MTSFVSTTLKVVWLTAQLRAVQATAQGRQDVLLLPLHHETRQRVALALASSLAEIDRLKAEIRRVERGAGLRSVARP